MAPQPLHPWKNTQASSGIVSTVRAPQCGQVSVPCRIGSAIPAWCAIGRASRSDQYISYSSWKRTAASGAAWSSPARTAAL